MENWASSGEVTKGKQNIRPPIQKRLLPGCNGINFLQLQGSPQTGTKRAVQEPPRSALIGPWDTTTAPGNATAAGGVGGSFASRLDKRPLPGPSALLAPDDGKPAPPPPRWGNEDRAKATPRLADCAIAFTDGFDPFQVHGGEGQHLGRDSDVCTGFLCCATVIHPLYATGGAGSQSLVAQLSAGVEAIAHAQVRDQPPAAQVNSPNAGRAACKHMCAGNCAGDRWVAAGDHRTSLDTKPSADVDWAAGSLPGMPGLGADGDRWKSGDH